MSERKYRSLSYSCEFRAAIQDCDAVLRANPDDEDALWIKSFCLRELRQFKRAIEYFQKLLKVNPHKSSAEYYAALLTKCLAFNSKHEWNDPFWINVTGKPVLIEQGAAAVFANDYNEVGLHLHNSSQFKEAILFFDMALDARPQHTIAWCNKGLALARLGEFKKAIECFDEAIAIEPTYVDALYSKAGCAFELRNYKLALDCYDRVIALNPNDIQAKQARSRTLQRYGKS
jgi:tetratricopeptide (TPR) repeat protein